MGGVGAIVALLSCDRILDIHDVPDATDDDGGCTTASCVNADVPSGWTIVAAAVGAKTPCPGDGGQFEQEDLAANPRVEPGSCACGCSVSGRWTCGEGEVDYGATYCHATTLGIPVAGCYGPNYFSFDGGSGAMFAGPPALEAIDDAGSLAQCTPSTVGDAAVQTDPVRVCRPRDCGEDTCALTAQGFSMCIEHGGAVACPSGFAPLGGTNGQVGSAASASATCNACSCVIDEAGTSTMQASIYTNPTCDDAGYVQDIAGCVVLDASVAPKIQSFHYAGQCTPGGTLTCSPKKADPGGDASITATATVCCLPN